MPQYVNDARLDRMNALYVIEYDRWCSRYNELALKGRGRWELVRNSSPNNDINADEYFEITGFTRRECRDRHDAEMWLETFARRAAMRAALETL
jgi:hypothetical protein